MNSIYRFMKHFFSSKNLIGFIISGLCIYWSFNNFQFEDFSKHIKSINYYLFIMASSILIFSVLIRSIRWLLFFKDEETKSLTLLKLFKNEMIGYFGNNIFPLRLGDLLRVSKMSKSTQMSQSYLLGTIVAERIIDIVSLFILLIVFLIFFWNNPMVYGLYKTLYGIIDFNNFIIYLFILAFLFVSGYFLLRKSDLFSWSLFKSAFLNIKGCKKIFKIIFLSLLIWGIYLLNIIIISYSMPGIDNLSIIDSFLLLIFVTLSIIILPSAPGTIGTFQASVIFVMTSSLFGYERSQAVSFSIILHAYSYITYSIVGGYFFLKSNVKLNN